MKKEDIIQTVKNNKDKLPFIAAILVAVLLIINFFLPYGCAKGAYRERLDEHSDVMYIDEIDMTAGEAKDMQNFGFTVKKIVDFFDLTAQQCVELLRRRSAALVSERDNIDAYISQIEKLIEETTEEHVSQ